jgi:hypothetical protein
MELTYRLTREDQQRAATLTAARVMRRARQVTSWLSRPGVLTLVAALLGVLPIGYLLVAKLISPLGYFVAIFAYLWGVVCMALCGRLSRRLFFKNWLPDNSPALSEVRLKLASDGIETSDQFRTSKFLWSAFSEVSEDGDLVLVWFDRVHAVIVPTRAFSSTEMRQTFIVTVRGHLLSTAG